MQTLIHCKNIYNDIAALQTLISTMQYTDCIFGQEIENFNYIPQSLDEFFSMVINTPVEIQPNTGLFRKPNTIIYYDPFFEHSLWTVVVALEDTKLKTYRHKDGYESYFNLPQDIDKDSFFIENCMNPDLWIEESVINIKANEFVLIRPWLWKSHEQDKLIQTFLLNYKLEE